MIIMKNRIIRAAAITAAMICTKPAFAVPLVELNYNEENGSAQVINSAGGSDYRVSFFAGKNPPERVPGVSGNALRTDGYSTWVTGPLNMPTSNQLALSTWIALESYPSTEETDLMDSSLMHQTADGRGFSLSINTYGEWWIRVNIAGQIVNLKAPERFPLYHWTHVAATVNNGQVTLFVNGVRVAQQQFVTGNIEFANNTPLVIARSDKPQTSFGVFEVNAINAAYDITRVYASVPPESQWLEEYQVGKDTPWRESIAVPETRFEDDVLRPRYHAMPPANWTNEPHGLVRFNGRYHMFYQRTPNGPYKWMMHWGHMVSDDLVYWENLKDAFYPALNTDGMSGLGSKGIWSGDVIADGDTAYAFYTTVNFDGQFDPGIAWATSTEANLEHWQKKGGLIDKNQPNPGGINDFRDPYLWKQDNRWHMIIGAAIGSGGALEHYTTTNLASGNWERASQPFTSLSFSSMDIGSAIWEMPVFEYIGEHNGQGKYVLVVSPIGGAMRKTEAPYVRSVYWTGTWDPNAANGAGQFIPDYAQPKNLDVIHGHLSPTITRAANGDLVAIGIVDERTNSQIQNDLGWAHTYSLPRVLRLLSDGKTLGQTPAIALQSLREVNEQETLSDVVVNGEHELPTASNQVEIIAEVNPAQTATSYGLVISASPDRDEYTRVYYDGDDLVIDKSNSSNLSGLEETGIYRGAYDEVAFGKPTKFHVFIDHSAIAVFINDKAVFENRIYPVRQDSQEIALYSAGGTTTFTQVVAYPLRAADSVTGPQVTVTGNVAIHEGEESGQELLVELSNGIWTAPLSLEDWNLSGAPEGVAIATLDRLSDSLVKLTLLGDSQADYDEDITNAQVQIAASQIAGSSSLPAAIGTLPRFTAIVEPVTTLTLSAPEPLTEGQEAGKSILIQLTNNQFKSPLDLDNWSIENLPVGLTYDLEWVSSQSVRLTLKGQAQDYDSDVVNFGITVQPAAFVDPDPELGGVAASVNSGITFTAKSCAIRYDFETGDLAGWCTSGGDAFTDLGVTDEANWWNGVFNHQGLFHYWGFNSGEDAAVGQMRSGTFVLEGDGQIHYRIAGGNDPENVYLALVRSSTHEILIKDTGIDSETYVERKFDASDFIGESVYLRVHDGASGGWGHINLDDIRVPVADELDGVMPIPSNIVVGINLSPANAELVPEQNLLLQVAVTPMNGCFGSLVWASSNTNVATVHQGVVTAVAPGEATITATSLDGNATAQAQIVVQEASPLRIYDFENASLAGWTVIGNAFTVGDISNATTFWQGESFNHQGSYHLWSHQEGGDGQLGELISDSFVLGGDGIIRVLLSGGSDLNNLYLALKRADGSELMRITGNNSEAYEEQVLDASAHRGETLRVHLVDNSVTGFGHINMDSLRIPTGPALSYRIFDFETGTLAGWTAQGAAFSEADVTDDSCFWVECLSFMREGNFHLWGFKAGGDTDQGELRSETFMLGGHGQIRALISGGNDIEKLYLALIDDQNGAELMRITGNDSEEFVERNMDASAFVGRRCYLKAVDQATGGWGHLNLDNIRIPLAQ